MRASCRLKLTPVAVLLLSALAFGQADQPTAAQQPTSQQPTAKPPAKPQPNVQQSVAGAARASRQAQESAPPTKVYRNKDVKDPAEAGSPATAGPSAAATSATGSAVTKTASLPISHPAAPSATPSITPTAAQIDAAQIQKDRAFEAQAKVFKSQILAEKGKIAGIQNRIADLKYQFDAWSTEYAQDPTDAQVCWTLSYYTPYYKDWCDTGRNLKAQYDASQRQLDQEKARLDQMQENIRHQGYGNAVYDPD